MMSHFPRMRRAFSCQSIAVVLAPAIVAAVALLAVPADAQQSAQDLRIQIDRLSGELGQVAGEVAQIRAASSGGQQFAQANDLGFRLGAIEEQLRGLTGEIENLRFQLDALERGGQVAAVGQSPALQAPAAQAPIAQPPLAPAPSGVAISSNGQNNGSDRSVAQAPADFSNNGVPALPAGAQAGAVPSVEQIQQGLAPQPLGGLRIDPVTGQALPADGSQLAGGDPFANPNGAPLDLTQLVTPGQPGSGQSFGAQPTPPGVAPQQQPFGQAQPDVIPGQAPQVAALPSSDDPRDHYDLAYGFILRGDYDSADAAFGAFLARFPQHELSGNASFWRGEALYMRGQYAPAARSFLETSQSFPDSPKAPDSLMRLGQSLGKLEQKDAACSTFAELQRRHPTAERSILEEATQTARALGC